MRKLLLISLILLHWCLLAQQRPDTSFVYNIPLPAFEKQNSPNVFIDGAHHNLHQMGTGFLPLTKLLQSDGFTIQPNTDSFYSTQQLKNCNVLVIANALHPLNINNWVVPNPSAFSEKEIEVIQEWVENGGSLLLIADHMPFGGAAQQLAKAFGAEWLNGFTGTGGRTWPPNTFYRSKNTFLDWAEDFPKYPIDSVATFTGSAIKLPQNAWPILAFTNADTALFCDTAWHFANATKTPLSGYVQGGIFNYGKGTVAVFAEAAMFTAQTVNEQFRVGFNSPNAPQNPQFVLNVFHYLARKKIGDYTSFRSRLKQNKE